MPFGHCSTAALAARYTKDRTFERKRLMASILPKFELMWNSYPKEERTELFTSIGWSDVVYNPNYQNTCSVRMSICLIRCGIRFPAWASDDIHNPTHPHNRVNYA